MLGGIVDLLLPSRCAACRGPAPDAGLCRSCEQSLVEAPPGCAVCGLGLGLAAEVLAVKPRRCPRCREKPPPFARARAAYMHGGALADALHRFKYAPAPQLARPLGVLLAPAADGALADVVAPVPLHPRRLRERGFDQAYLLAKAVARRLGLPLEGRLARRVRATRPQVGLDRLAREANVRGAFWAGPAARGLRVLLVDDVFTTGATAAACAAALKEAGARRVEVLTLCLAP